MTTNDLYYEAADILKKVKEKRGTIKTLIYASGFKNLRQMFALVSECMKNRLILEEIATGCPKSFLRDDAIQQDVEVAIVLLYEYLLGRKFGRAVGLRKLFQRYKADIKSVVDKVVEQHGASTLKEACQMSGQALLPKIPRYMRVNLIKSSVESAIKDLQSEHWEFVGKFSQDDFRTRALAMTHMQFGLDPMLPDLLVFPPGTDLHDHCLTRSGNLVQQDRASCIPAHVLSPGPASTVLDTCAAPGNKTSHVASLLKDNGRVIALDRDFKRLGTMTRLLSNSGATCVELIHQDFLTVEPSSADAGDIQFILVDPSCSGSGMLNNQTNSSTPDMNTERIQTLKRFQISILKHALKFPSVQRVVYSTCSVHQQENEEVAEEVMSQVGDQFEFAKIFPSWRGSRGLSEFPHAENFLRLSPGQDLTQGFFVACFERVKFLDEKEEEEDNNCRQIGLREDSTSSQSSENSRKKSQKVVKLCAGGSESSVSHVQTETLQQTLSGNVDFSTTLPGPDVPETTKRKKKRKCERLEVTQDNSHTESVAVPVPRKKKKNTRKNSVDVSDLKSPEGVSK